MTPTTRISHSNSQGCAEADSYDVFINFRGFDTRDNIVSVLCKDLANAPGNITVFYDDKSMSSGDEIHWKLKQGILNSQIYICVFSQNYATSKWCLRELAMMNDERKERGKHILPIFFDVEVDTVKLKESSYLDQLQRDHHAEDPKTVAKWKEALKDVAGIKGPKMSDFRDTAKLSESVVSAVSGLLTTRPLSYFLVGMEEKVSAVVRSLDVDSSDVQLLIIHGESGIGKTTVAREVFSRLCGTCFDSCSFVEDIDGSQLHRPQPSSSTYFMKHVLKDIPDDSWEEMDHNSPIDKEELKRRFSESFKNKKVLIVLDNITQENDIKQLKSVWFGPGSRIIVTTEVRRIWALAKDSINKSKEMKVEGLKVRSFEMKGMKYQQAIQLFSRHAFRRDSPPKQLEELSSRIVSHIEELPLTLEVIGAFLHRKPKEVFIKTEQKLVGITTNRVQKILRISYDELAEAKDIFLDIACFFINKEKSRPIHMWQNAYHTSTVEDLTKVCLVKIVDNDKLWMHEQLKKMGRDIVQKEPEPNRLWEYKEALEVLQSGYGSDIVQALRICTDGVLDDSKFGPEHFRMERLRFLQLYSGSADGKMKSLRELRWLSWRRCGANSLKADLSASSLVILDLSFSSITHEWSGWENLEGKAVCLRVLDLQGCKELTRPPNLRPYNCLERLILEDCQNLETIDDSSICELKELKYLNLKGCDSLRGLPENIGALNKLVELVITKRNRGPLRLPKSMEKLKSLRILEIVNINFSDLHLPIPTDDDHGQETLTRLSLLKCSVDEHGSKELPDSLGSLTSLVELDISSTNFVKFPDSMERLKELKVLKMESSMIVRLPSGIGELKNLEELHAKCSKDLKQVPEYICKLLKLKLLDLSSTKVSYLGSSLPENLECLRLPIRPPRPCHTLTNERIWTCNPGCVDIDDLCEQTKLVRVDTTGNPPEVTSAFSLNCIRNLTRLERLELTVPNYTEVELKSLRFSFPDQLKSLNLSCKGLSWCSNLPSNLSALCLNHVEGPTDLQMLSKLSSLRLYKCSRFEIGDVKSLQHFSASSCDFGMIKELRLPVHLQVLSLNRCKFQEKSSLNLSSLTHLKQLELVSCDGLVKVDGIGQLHQLLDLRITNCALLERFGDWKFLEEIKRGEEPKCSFSYWIHLFSRNSSEMYRWKKHFREAWVYEVV